MTYKRNIDRLPILPKDAKEFNVVCHYCIVGCGYKAFTGDQQTGRTAPDQNKFGVDLGKQQAPKRPLGLRRRCTTSSAERRGRTHRDQARQGLRCEFRPRLGRGARMAEMAIPAREYPAPAADRPVGLALWADVADELGRRLSGGARHRAVIEEKGEDGLFVSAFDHGGAGGGYENTWGTGKLYFGAMKVKNIRIHNRPAYNSEVHATRDMGVANSTTATRTPSSPTRSSLSAPTRSRRRPIISSTIGCRTCAAHRWTRRRPSLAEPVERLAMIIVDPRRTVTVNACEVEAGKDA